MPQVRRVRAARSARTSLVGLAGEAQRERTRRAPLAVAERAAEEGLPLPGRARARRHLRRRRPPRRCPSSRPRRDQPDLHGRRPRRPRPPRARTRLRPAEASGAGGGGRASSRTARSPLLRDRHRRLARPSTPGVSADRRARSAAPRRGPGRQPAAEAAPPVGPGRQGSHDPARRAAPARSRSCARRRLGRVYTPAPGARADRRADAQRQRPPAVVQLTPRRRLPGVRLAARARPPRRVPRRRS